MKKIILFVLLLVLLNLNIYKSEAFTPAFSPQYIDIVTSSEDTPIFKAGDKVDLNISLSNNNTPLEKTQVEYGIVREIVSGNTTDYEPIKVLKIENSYSIGGTKKMNFEIPNVLNKESDTYVFYAKISVIDDIDKENFIVSGRNFKIEKDNSIPITKILGMNLLHSNGKRFGLLHGPTIYDLTKTTYKGVASSTSLEITLESNTDIILNPNITFNKLRSDISVPDFKPNQINVKNGITNIVIPLPKFDYEPGVYQGVMKFNNVDIPDVNFQYIIAGDSVTIGQPVYESNLKEHTFSLPIYSTPVDMDLNVKLNDFSTSTIEKMLSPEALFYDSEFIIQDKDGKELHKTNQSIDFATSTYQLVLSSKINLNKIDKILIKVKNGEGKVIYEGVKNIDLPTSDKLSILKISLLVLLFVVLITLLILFKHKYFRILLTILTLLTLLFGIQIFTAKAGVWFLGMNDGYLIYEGGDTTYVRHGAFASTGYLYKFSTNIRETAYSVNSDFKFTYSAVHTWCHNYWEGLSTGFSLNSQDEAWTNRATISSPNILQYLFNYYDPSVSDALNSDDTSGEYVFSQSGDRFTIKTKYRTVNLGKPKIGDSLYIERLVSERHYSDVRFKVPILNITNETVSDRCVDGKINHVVSIGNAPYEVREILTPTTDDCSGVVPFISTSIRDVTATQGRLVWEYSIPNPVQENYQAQISTTSFATISEEVVGKPIVMNENKDSITKLLSFAKDTFVKTALGQTSASDTRSVLFSGLKPLTTYQVRARVHNGDNWSSWSVQELKTKAENAGQPCCDLSYPLGTIQDDGTCKHNTTGQIIVDPLTNAMCQGLFSVGCSVSPSKILNGGSATFTAEPRNAPGSVDYTWYNSYEDYDDEGSLVTMTDVLSTNRIYTDTFTGVKDQKIWVELAATSNGVIDSTSCYVTITDNLTPVVVEPVKVNKFKFEPSFVNSGENCGVSIDVEDVASCSLKNKAGVSYGSWTSDDFKKINVPSIARDIPVGTYMLSCSSLDETPVIKNFGTEKCMSNSDIQEGVIN